MSRSSAASLAACGKTYAIDEVRVGCPECGSLLDVAYDWDRLELPAALDDFESKWAARNDPLCLSGVWRFRELLPFAQAEQIVTIGEGQTMLRPSDRVARYVGLRPGRLYLQYEGLNPSGSFKDNGMTAAFTHAHAIGANARRVCIDRQYQCLAGGVLFGRPGG